METTTPDLFISHSKKDDPEVDRIAEALRAAGLSVWVDHQNGIPIGSPSFDQMIQDNLSKCKRGLLILTGDSARSLECNGEWRYLLTHKRLYVARLKDFPQHEFPSRLAIIQYANLLRDYGEGLDALIQALQKNALLDASHPGTALALRRSGQFPDAKLSLPLVGREPDLATVSQLLGGAGAVVLTGPGGVGKTRLAAELAALAANDDGVIWYTLASAATKADAEKDLRNLTGLIREHFPSELAATFDLDAVWAYLGKSQALLVLDNAEDCQCPQPFIRQLEKLRTDGIKQGVLLTSRHFWPGLTAREHQVLIPSPPDGIRIMQEMLDFWLETHQARPSVAEVEALAAAARHHPRLMEFAAVWMKYNDTETVATWLRELRSENEDDRGELAELLDRLMTHTLRLVAQEPKGPLALTALRRLLACRGGWTMAAAKALLADLPGAIGQMRTLMEWNVVRRTGDRYDLDPLVRAVEAPDPATFPLHYDYYKALARQHNERQDYAGLVPEAANLEAAFEWAMRSGEVKKAYWLVHAQAELLHNQGRIIQELQWLEQVLNTLPKVVEYNLAITLFNSLGNSYLLLSDIQEQEANLDLAINAYRIALAHATQVNDPSGFAMTYNNLGNIYRCLSTVREREINLDLSLHTLLLSLHYYTELDDLLGFARTQNNLGSTYCALSKVRAPEHNLALAITAYQTSLHNTREVSVALDFASVQNNLGNAYLALARLQADKINFTSDVEAYDAVKNSLDLAVLAYQNALTHYTEAAAPYNFAMTQSNLGNAYRDLALLRAKEALFHMNQSLTAYQAALVYLTETKAPLDFININNNMGNGYRAMLESMPPQIFFDNASEAYEAAQRVAAQHSVYRLYAGAIGDTGSLMAAVGNYPLAIQYWQEARLYFEKTDDLISANQLNAAIIKAEEKLRNPTPTAAS